ncbi:MAG: hypothetical protein HFF00_04485 [Ruminiclostridium sp.]|nr:hypothetical protein [Ruminiclostridium sp.]
MPTSSALNQRMVDPGTVFIDGTHIKTSANKKKFQKEQVAKGEHKRQFAYEAHTACNQRGWVLGVEVTAGIP